MNLAERLAHAFTTLGTRRSGLSLRERWRLSRIPRYTPTETVLDGHRVKVPDAASFLVGFDEIFGRKIYDFAPANAAPFIIDCGANIGLACIFWKRRFPGCRVAALEPDPGLVEALYANVASFELPGVTVHAVAAWTTETVLEFWHEGGASGRLAPGASGEQIIRVPTMRLRDLLVDRVDLLKLDIEGAETDVLADCADRLGAVDRVFVEYHSERGRPQTLHRVLALLHDAGFRYHLTEALAARRPFISRPNSFGMDLQTNVFGFRD